MSGRRSFFAGAIALATTWACGGDPTDPSGTTLESVVARIALEQVSAAEERTLADLDRATKQVERLVDEQRRWRASHPPDVAIATELGDARTIRELHLR